MAKNNHPFVQQLLGNFAAEVALQPAVREARREPHVALFEVNRLRRAGKEEK